MDSTTTIQPTIVWVQYQLAGETVQPGALTGNVVDYNAVQAGQYSPAICVRPQFSGTTSGPIGSVRLWWSTTGATHLGTDTNIDLPANQWVLKYYVTDCSDSLLGDKTSLSDSERCAKMLSYLSSSERVSVVATGRTFDSKNFQSNNTSYTWCRSVWQGSSDDNVSMQPVPFTGYEDKIVAHESSYSSRYGASWSSIVFDDTRSYEPGQLMYYAAGGVLTSSAYKCNVKGCVTSNDNNDGTNASGFPYIFFTIKAPTDAPAGTWSGWACRISYIWPYTATTTSTTT